MKKVKSVFDNDFACTKYANGEIKGPYEFVKRGIQLVIVFTCGVPKGSKVVVSLHC